MPAPPAWAVPIPEYHLAMTLLEAPELGVQHVEGQLHGVKPEAVGGGDLQHAEVHHRVFMPGNPM